MVCRLVSCLFIAISLLLAGCERQQSIDVLDSEPVTLLADERTLFINYWAVWCIPCLEEMPVLSDFREANLTSAEVYAFNFDQPEIEKLRADVAHLDVQIPSLLEDPAPLLGTETPTVLPTTLVVKNGEIVDLLIGPQTSESLAASLAKVPQ